MKTQIKFNKKEREYLAHALLHLEDNKIAVDDSPSGWFSGNKKQFIKKHKKAIMFIKSLITPENREEK